MAPEWILLAATFVFLVVVGLSPGRLQGPLLAGVLLGAPAGAVLMTLVMLLAIALANDPNRDDHNDGLIFLIGPAMGAVPGAIVGAAVGCLKEGYRKVAGWILAISGTAIAVPYLWLAVSARANDSLLVALFPAAAALWGWCLIVRPADGARR